MMAAQRKSPVAGGEGTLLLINPAARQGESDVSALTAQLETLGRVLVPPAGDVGQTRAAIAAHAPGVARVVIGGGDGSVSAVLPQLLSADRPLGVLPLGTANDFARSLNIRDPGDALAVIVQGHTRQVDVGIVNERPFLNAVGIGLGPRINADLARETKSRFGVLSYLLSFLRHARAEHSMRAEITCDGRTARVRSLQITVGNGIHYGGGMTVAEDASLEDGQLDVVSIRPQGAWQILLQGLALRSGKVEDAPRVDVFRGERVDVRTRGRLDATADGERVTQTPLECRIMRAALTVYAPAPEELQ